MSDYNEMVRELREKIKRGEFYIEKRSKKSDRRKAFFSWVLIDRRVGGDRRRLSYV